MFYVYFIQSEVNGHYYVGQCEDLEARLLQHNRGRVKYTKPLRPWTLKYYETYETRGLSINREKELKNSRSKKLEVIARITMAPSSSG